MGFDSELIGSSVNVRDFLVVGGLGFKVPIIPGPLKCLHRTMEEFRVELYRSSEQHVSRYISTRMPKLGIRPSARGLGTFSFKVSLFLGKGRTMTGAGLPVPHDVAPAHVRPGWGFAGFTGF